MDFTVTSPAFGDGAAIPVRHTCDGDDVSPALRWDGVPRGSRSLAMIVDDPDAPRGTFTHWVVYDLPESLRDIAEGEAPGTPGRNSFGRIGYSGPCPPPGHGPHRYRFTLYALDLPAIALESGTREELEARMETHVLGTARLTGVYERK